MILVDLHRNLGAEHRWLAVGQSGDAEARRAGREAAAAALGGRADPKLVIVFCCETYDLAELVEGIRAEAGDTPLIGCSTAGEISTAGLSARQFADPELIDVVAEALARACLPAAPSGSRSPRASSWRKSRRRPTRCTR